MNILTLSFGVIALVAAGVFGRCGWLEISRFRSLRKTGLRTKGTVISEFSRRIGERPLPIIRFQDEKGLMREFRSHFPRRSKGFVHPEEVEVLYHSDCAELAETGPAVRWIVGYLIFAVFMFSASIASALVSFK